MVRGSPASIRSPHLAGGHVIGKRDSTDHETGSGVHPATSSPRSPTSSPRNAAAAGGRPRLHVRSRPGGVNATGNAQGASAQVRNHEQDERVMDESVLRQLGHFEGQPSAREGVGENTREVNSIQSANHEAFRNAVKHYQHHIINLRIIFDDPQTRIDTFAREIELIKKSQSRPGGKDDVKAHEGLLALRRAIREEQKRIEDSTGSKPQKKHKPRGGAAAALPPSTMSNTFRHHNTTSGQAQVVPTGQPACARFNTRPQRAARQEKMPTKDLAGSRPSMEHRQRGSAATVLPTPGKLNSWVINGAATASVQNVHLQRAAGSSTGGLWREDSSSGTLTREASGSYALRREASGSGTLTREASGSGTFTGEASGSVLPGGYSDPYSNVSDMDVAMLEHFILK